MLLTGKSFEIFPKHDRYFFISESFALNQYIFVALTTKKLLVLLKVRLRQNSLFDLVKLIEYSNFAVIVVSSHFCVGPLPRINISFFVTSMH